MNNDEHFRVEALSADEARAARSEYWEKYPDVYGDFFPNSMRIMSRNLR